MHTIRIPQICVRIEETAYNESGKILKKSWSGDDGETYSVYDYKYDEKGRLVEILFTEEGEDVGFRKTTYNDKNQILTEQVCYAVGYEYTNVFEYDEQGNVIKTTYSDSDSEGRTYSDVIDSTYKLVYLPFEYSEEDGNLFPTRLSAGT